VAPSPIRRVSGWLGTSQATVGNTTTMQEEAPRRRQSSLSRCALAAPPAVSTIQGINHSSQGLSTNRYCTFKYASVLLAVLLPTDTCEDVPPAASTWGESREKYPKFTVNAAAAALVFGTPQARRRQAPDFWASQGCTSHLRASAWAAGPQLQGLPLATCQPPLFPLHLPQTTRALTWPPGWPLSFLCRAYAGKPQ